MGSLPLRRKNTAGGTGPTGPTGPQGPAGVNGKQVEFQVTASHIQWRFVGETWYNLIALSSIIGPQGPQGLTGAQGAPGTNARNIELNTSATHLQWRLVGDAGWTNLLPLSSITGPQGATGPQGNTGPQGPAGSPGSNGREVEIQTNATHIQWRYSGDTTWNNLIALSAITGATGPQGPQGPAGAAGTNGTNGTNGKQIEVQNNGTHLQWRYVGETWANLVSLSAITGPQGPQGIQGPQGPAGPADWNAIPNKPAFGDYAFRSVGLAELTGATFTGSFNVFNSNQGVRINGLSIGNSGGNYATLGYNVSFTSTGDQWNYLYADYASFIRYQAGGFQFYTAPIGTPSSPITASLRHTLDNNGNASWSGNGLFEGVLSSKQINTNPVSGSSLAGTHTGTGTNAGAQWKFLNDYNSTGAFIGLAAENTGDAVFAVGASKKLVFASGTTGNERIGEFTANAFRIFKTAGNSSGGSVYLGALDTNQNNTWLFGRAFTGTGYVLDSTKYVEININGTTHKLATIQ